MSHIILESDSPIRIRVAGPLLLSDGPNHYSNPDPSHHVETLPLHSRRGGSFMNPTFETTRSEHTAHVSPVGFGIKSPDPRGEAEGSTVANRSWLSDFWAVILNNLFDVLMYLFSAFVLGVVIGWWWQLVHGPASATDKSLLSFGCGLAMCFNLASIFLSMRTMKENSF